MKSCDRLLSNPLRSSISFLRLWVHTSSVLALASHISLLAASEEIFKLHKHCRRGARGSRWWMTDPTVFLHTMMKCLMSTKASNREVCIGQSRHMVACRSLMFLSYSSNQKHTFSVMRGRKKGAEVSFFCGESAFLSWFMKLWLICINIDMSFYCSKH